MEIGQLLQTDADPRINFALHSMCKSSPPFRLYHAERLDEELDKAMIEYLNGEIEVQDAKKRKVWKIGEIWTEKFFQDVFLPKVFEWYSADFSKSPKDIPNWITMTGARLMTDWNTSTSPITQVESPGAVIKYKDWDWSFAFRDAAK